MITVNPIPYPRPDLAAIVATDVPGDVSNATTMPNVDEVVGTPRDPAAPVTSSAVPWVSAVEGRTETVTLDPNDPSYHERHLWGMNGTNGINAPAAWNVTTGSPATVIAEIDTGIDYDHPDLYQNIWINQAEIPAQPDEEPGGRLPRRLHHLRPT